MSKKKIKRITFLVFTLLITIVLFMQRKTGMGIHACLGLILFIGSICHTIKFRKVWKVRTTYQKLVEVLIWLGLAGSMITGFLLKPFAGVFLVLLMHKLTAIFFAIGLLLHIKYALQKKQGSWRNIHEPSIIRNYLFKINFVNSTGSTIFPSLYTRIFPEAISSIRITSLLL